MATDMLAERDALRESTGPGGLVLRRLSKRFESVLALDDCSFAVPRGRMLGFPILRAVG